MVTIQYFKSQNVQLGCQSLVITVRNFLQKFRQEEEIIVFSPKTINQIAVVNAIKENDFCECDCYKIQHMESLFTKPANSKDFLIAYLPRHLKGKQILLRTSKLVRKVVTLPYKTGVAIFPSLHEVEKGLNHDDVVIKYFSKV